MKFYERQKVPIAVSPTDSLVEMRIAEKLLNKKSSLGMRL